MSQLEAVWKRTDYTRHASTFERLSELALMSLRALKVAPLPFIVGIVSAGAVIAAVGVILSVMLNISALVGSSHKNIPVTVYLPDGASETSALRSELTKAQGVERVTYTSKKDALAAFQASLGKDSVALQGIEENNPLPASFELYFADEESLNSFVDKIAPALKEKYKIASVEVDQTLIGAIHNGIRSLSLLIFAGGGLLLAIAASVIACAVTLILHAHRREIEVLSLVGARESFIQAPYILEGAFQGLLGGILGAGISWGAMRLIHSATIADGILKQFVSNLCVMSGTLAAMLCILSVIVGAGSSWICVKRSVKV
jgi:cell division transport system permease protein